MGDSFARYFDALPDAEKEAVRNVLDGAGAAAGAAPPDPLEYANSLGAGAPPDPLADLGPAPVAGPAELEREQRRGYSPVGAGVNPSGAFPQALPPGFQSGGPDQANTDTAVAPFGMPLVPTPLLSADEFNARKEAEYNASVAAILAEKGIGLDGNPLPASGGGASVSGSGAPGAGGIIAGLETLRKDTATGAADIATQTAAAVRREQEAQDAGAQLIKTSEENKRLAIEEGLKTDLFHQTLQADAEQKHADFMDAANKHIDNRIASFTNVSRDPWAEAGTAGRITDSLAIILGGMGQGMLRYGAKDSGAVNLGLKMIEKRIEQDLDSRKFEINADIRQADAASAEFNSASGRRQIARAAALHRVAMQVESEGARYKSASAMNNAAQLKEALMQKSLEARGKALDDSATQSRLIYATELQAKDLGLRGWMATHATPKDARWNHLESSERDKLSKLIASGRSLAALKGQYTKLSALAGAGKIIPGSEAQLYESMMRTTRNDYIQAMTGAGMSQDEAERYMDTIPNAGDWKGTAANKFDAILGTTETKARSIVDVAEMDRRDVSGFRQMFPAAAPIPERPR